MKPPGVSLALQGRVVALARDGTNGLLLTKRDAYDVIIRQLRSHAPDRKLWFIALARHGSQVDGVRATAAGFVRYLIELVEIAVLSTMLCPAAVGEANVGGKIGSVELSPVTLLPCSSPE